MLLTSQSLVADLKLVANALLQLKQKRPGGTSYHHAATASGSAHTVTVSPPWQMSMSRGRVNSFKPTQARFTFPTTSICIFPHSMPHLHRRVNRFFFSPSSSDPYAPSPSRSRDKSSMGITKSIFSDCVSVCQLCHSFLYMPTYILMCFVVPCMICL